MTLAHYLWIGFALNFAAFLWIGRNFISQPRMNWPPIFWNPVAQAVGVTGPWIVFFAIIICGSVWTDQGWWYLGASIVAMIVGGVRPRFD